MNWPLLFGDVEGVIKIALIILFVVFPLIGQIFKGTQGDKPAERPGPQPRRRPAPRDPARPQANVQGGAQDALRGEIDTFLQRASQRRGANPAQQVEILEPEVIEEVAPRRLVEAIRTQPSPLDSRAKNAGRPIQSETSGQYAERLGSQVGLADEKTEGHLQQVFEHKIGTLTDTSRQGPHDQEHIAEGTDSLVWQTTASQRERQSESAAEMAQEVASMLRNPSSLKEAIILSEILRRPGDQF